MCNLYSITTNKVAIIALCRLTAAHVLIMHVPRSAEDQTKRMQRNSVIAKSQQNGG